MAKFEKRIQAHKLRRKGRSIKSIAEELEVAKSTVSLWCRDLKPTKDQRNNLKQKQIAAGHRGRMIGAEMNRRKKQENVAEQYDAAKKLVGTLSERDKLMLGIGLYWGEGTKSAGDPASLVNSDPDIVLMMRDWFESLGVEREEFNPYIFISEIHRPREGQIVAFWSEYLSFPEEQFHKVTFLKGRPKKIYENYDSYFGIMALRVKRSTTLKYKILGLIEVCKEGGKK